MPFIATSFVVLKLVTLSQESFSFSEFICLTGVNGLIRTAGFVCPPEILMLMKLHGRQVPRLRLIHHTTNRCQENMLL